MSKKACKYRYADPDQMRDLVRIKGKTNSRKYDAAKQPAKQKRLGERYGVHQYKPARLSCGTVIAFFEHEKFI